MMKLWAVMKAYSFADLSVIGMPLKPDKGEPERFIPVFKTKEDAVAWAGTAEAVTELITPEEVEE